MTVMIEEDEVIDLEAEDFIDPTAFDDFVEPRQFESPIILEDAFGKYMVLPTGERVPVRNGGPIAGLHPKDDWDQAKQVDGAIRSGAMRPGGVPLGFRTFTAGPWANWTMYRTLGYWHDLVWAAGSVAAFVPAAFWVAGNDHSKVWLWCIAYVSWSGLCQIPAESDAKISARAAR